MKKIIIACALLIITFVWLPAQSITITSPTAGATWLLESSHAITWTYKGLPDNTQVKVILFLGNEKKGLLVESTGIGSNGSGSWTWSHAGDYIGGKAAAKSGYKIRVRDLGNQCPIMDSGAFTLEGIGNLPPIISNRGIGNKVGLVGKINVTMPAQGLQVKPGDGLAIKWDKIPIASYPQVKFGVYLPDCKTYHGPIHKTGDGLKPNTGHYDDAVIATALYEVGKEYVIRVATPDDKFIGFSGVFRVIPLEAVQKTKIFHGSQQRAYHNIEQSKWFGCLYSLGEGPNYATNGYAVGWENDMDDPDGPCWKYVGHIYRTVLNPPDIHKGELVTKAVLRFTVNDGTKQNFSILQPTVKDNPFGPANILATISSWEFGQGIEVDVTATVQAWTIGFFANYGLIICGGNEQFSHNNDKARCVITDPQLVVTMTEYQ